MYTSRITWKIHESKNHLATLPEARTVTLKHAFDVTHTNSRRRQSSHLYLWLLFHRCYLFQSARSDSRWWATGRKPPRSGKRRCAFEFELNASVMLSWEWSKWSIGAVRYFATEKIEKAFSKRSWFLHRMHAEKTNIFVPVASVSLRYLHLCLCFCRLSPMLKLICDDSRADILISHRWLL